MAASSQDDPSMMSGYLPASAQDLNLNQMICAESQGSHLEDGKAPAPKHLKGIAS